jgi:hypothetical protein
LVGNKPVFGKLNADCVLSERDAQMWANETGGHVVPLAELEPVEVSEEEAEILRMAKTSGHPYGYIYAHTHTAVNEDRLMRAYVIGWTAENPKRWNVKVPHTKDVWYYKYWNSDLRTISDKELCSEFTEAEIEHYGLQDCEKEEVTDDEQ